MAKIVKKYQEEYNKYSKADEMIRNTYRVLLSKGSGYGI